MNVFFGICEAASISARKVGPRIMVWPSTNWPKQTCCHPTTMRPDTAAATFDYRQQHAGRWPAEANTTALGFRANLGVADHLFGSGEDTYSETVRNKNVGTGMTSLRIYRGSDYAVTADGGDYTVHFVVGLDPEGQMYLLDRWRKQSASDEWIESFCDFRDRMEAGWLAWVQWRRPMT
jgi:hypothetical protein